MRFEESFWRKNVWCLSSTRPCFYFRLVDEAQQKTLFAYNFAAHFLWCLHQHTSKLKKNINLHFPFQIAPPQKNIYIYHLCWTHLFALFFSCLFGWCECFLSLGNILNLQVFPSSRSRPWACTLLRCSLGRGLGVPYMDVSLKIGEFPPKMDGENHGKVYNQMDDFGGKRYHYFLETSYYTYIMNGWFLS